VKKMARKQAQASATKRNQAQTSETRISRRPPAENRVYNCQRARISPGRKMKTENRNRKATGKTYENNADQHERDRSSGSVLYGPGSVR